MRRALLLGVAAVASACSWSPGSEPKQEAPPDVKAKAALEPIRLGEVASLTGPNTEFGISMRNGIELAIAEANARGGVQGRALSLYVYDDQSTPAGAVRAARRLLERDGVQLMLGEAASTLSLAIAPLAQDAGVPMVTPSSTNPAVTQVGDFIFRVCFDDTFQGLVMARFAREELKLERVAVLVEKTSVYSVGLAAEFARRFRELGGEVVFEGSYAKGDTDFRPLLGASAMKGAQAIYLPGYVAEVVQIAQQSKQLGLGAVLLGGDAWDSEAFFETGGAWLEGAYLTNHATADDPSVQDFVARYRQAFGSVPDARAFLASDAARVSIDALKRAGGRSGTALRDALAGTRDLDGVTGKLNFDAKRNAVKPAAILRVKGAGFVLVRKIAP